MAGLGADFIDAELFLQRRVVGDEKEGGFVRYKNFELKAKVKGEPSSNSGIYFHTDLTLSKGPGWLDKGYEVQLNSTEKEKRKTGSLYAVAGEGSRRARRDGQQVLHGLSQRR